MKSIKEKSRRKKERDRNNRLRGKKEAVKPVFALESVAAAQCPSLV